MPISFAERLRTLGKAAVGLFSATSSEQARAMLAGIIPGAVGTPPKRGTRELLNAYSEMPWLRAVVNRVTTSVASTPWQLYVVRPGGAGKAVKAAKAQQADYATRRQLLAGYRKAGELVEIEEHPLLDLLNRPNSFFVGLVTRQLTQMHLDLAGEAFWLKERNGVGKPAALWPIPPDWITGTPTPGRPLFRVSFRGWQGEIPDTEILWMVDPDPANPYGRGSSMARALSDELEIDEYAAKHVKGWFYNRARPDLIVTAEGLSKDETARLEEAWNARNQGFWRAYKTFFLNRKVDVQQLSQTFENMQLVDLRKNERDTIVHVYGAPPEIFGIVENSNRATIEAADYIYSRWVIVPRLEFLRANIQERLVPEFDERLILDYVSPVAEDKEYNLKVAQAAPWSLTVDEWRALQGQEPLANDQGKVHMVPFNLLPTRDLGAVQSPPTPAPPQPEASAGGQEGVPAPEGEPAPKAVKAALRREDLERLLAILSLDPLLRHLKPNYRDVIQAFGQEMIDSLSVDAVFDLLNPAVVEFLKTTAGEMIKGINQTTLQALRETLIEGVEAGESIPKLADRIAAVFAEAKGRRSEVIARTEVLRASNFGALEGMRQAGAEQKEWLATRDDRVRDAHLKADGQVRALSEPFIVGGEELMYPGDPAGSPENTIQCRCTVLPRVGERSLYETEEKRAAAWQKYDTGLRPWERRMKTAAVKAFQEQQDTVMAELKRLGRE
ncbi:MAG: phage portal protein [Bacillota bacterium]|nr:phage portal protein [Bacillota bacterium]